jgi:hypothetical protein
VIPAFEELGTQFGLEPPDRTTHRRRREMKGLRRPGQRPESMEL